MDQLRSMRTFTSVVDCGSFAAAARSLDMAPAMVTRQVADLEARLGARLLTRTTRRIALTPIGQHYLERLRPILTQLDEAETAVMEGQQRVQGRVRIAATPAFAAHQLAPRLARLQARHRDIRIELTAQGPVESPHEAQDISIAVCATPMEGDFVAHKLARSEVVLCAAPGYLLQHGMPRHPRELVDHQLLVAAQGVPRHVVMTGPEHERHDFQVPASQVRLASPNAELTQRAALAAMGIAGLPSFAVHDALRQGRLVRVLPDWHLFDLAILACLPSRRQVPAVIRATLDFLRAEFPGDDRDPWLVPAAPSSPPPLPRETAFQL